MALRCDRDRFPQIPAIRFDGRLVDVLCVNKVISSRLDPDGRRVGNVDKGFEKKKTRRPGTRRALSPPERA